MPRRNGKKTVQTGGYGNDSLMILAPIGMAVVVGGILFGGPANAAEAINTIVRNLVNGAMTLVSAWF
jgi:hypothetical protein